MSSQKPTPVVEHFSLRIEATSDPATRRIHIDLRDVQDSKVVPLHISAEICALLLRVINLLYLEAWAACTHPAEKREDTGYGIWRCLDCGALSTPKPQIRQE